MDHKRKSALQADDAGDDGSQSRKRKAMDTNGHKDDGMPWKENLETFQKDAIWRQMQEYKREKNTLEAQVGEMAKRAAHHDDHLRIIDAWFRQLLDEVTTVAGDGSSSTATDGEGSPRFPSALLFSDNSQFQEHLQAHSDNIKSTLSRLFQKWPQSPAPDLAQLQKRVNHMLAAEKQHEVEATRLRSERDQLNERLENASQRYIAAEKQLDRLKSQAVADLAKRGLIGSDAVITASSGGANGDVNVTLDIAHKEAVAVAEKHKEHVTKLEAENANLTEQVTALTAKVAVVSDDDYAATDLFRLMKSQYEDVINRVNDLEAVNIQLRAEAAKLQAERTAYKDKVQVEIQAPMGELQQKLSRAEMDLARIRAARDELNSEVAIRKASSERERASYSQMRELVGAKEDRVVALEAEMERLKLQYGESKGDPPSEQELSDMKVDELISKYKKLEREHFLINRELPAMGEAWKKASAAASKKVADTAALEDRVARLQAEKAKADQKYFATMKLNEAREGEVRTLRAQNNRASDMMVQLKEAEAGTRRLVSNLEKQMSETKVALSNLTTQNRQLQQNVTQGNIAFRGLREQVSQLTGVLRQKDDSMLATKKNHRQLETEAEKLRVRLVETEKSAENWKRQVSGQEAPEAEAMRTLLLCNVCNSDLKDTALKTCGHLLCKSCVDERIASRSRRCPICARPFGAGDSMPVHF
ncbi:MAG: E3 ubiquitin-protein ligase bre1 [Watsoniomyces obsoletus]|nr:MAG: E3 ubiquitin-protein ligase bre1 [Watsoniomyces obsoletus]